MPSQLHEMLLLLFRNRPALAPELLREALRLELPAYSEVRLESADLTDVVPAEYRADLVVLLVEGKPVLGIVVEAQLTPDARKRFSWPVYVTGLRARLECPCCLLVITASDKTAAWAREPIALGPGSTLEPFVIGPQGVPVVTDPERAKRDPELAVLSVMAHGRGDVKTAVQIALSAAAAAAPLDEDTRVLYFDVIEAALSEAARKAFEMLPENYEFQGPTYKKARLEGLRDGRLEGLRDGRLEGLRDGRLEGLRDGRLEGRLEGQLTMAAASVLDFLEARGLSVSDGVRRRVHDSADIEQLRLWIRRAAVVTCADELFEP